ncbi:hypothetical protein J6590_038724 [Homalodisca vitripennis]|nr:hypothetical protein J6590_038724 [Homalodisca vitripennis]
MVFNYVEDLTPEIWSHVRLKRSTNSRRRRMKRRKPNPHRFDIKDTQTTKIVI